MNKREKEVLEETLKNEKKVLKELDKVYAEALTEIDDKILQLLARDDGNMQNVIYQVEYQKALKQQIESAIDTLHSKEFTSVSEYLTDCYNTGFTGAVYDMHGQNIPLILPISHEDISRAVTHDTKLSQPLYESLGKDVKKLKQQIASELSVGIATSQSYADIHRNITTVAGINKNKAMRIARTEGHRIQQTASYDAQKKAKEKGADIVKQWSAALDGRTRDSHRRVDGEIRELDKSFSNDLMYPGDPNGPAAEVVNCRCTISQRAKWRLDEDELKILQDRAKFFGLDKTESLKDFENKYLKITTNPAIQLEKYESDFKKLTDGYSYDDFLKDFGSVEEGFEGADRDEILKAKNIADKIEAFRGKLTFKDNVTVYKREKSIEMLQRLGVDVKDKSSDGVSDENLSKFAEFITNFEYSHSGYFAKNKLQLKSIEIVDYLKEHDKMAGGAYYPNSKSIKLMKKAIDTKATSKLITYSRSDDYHIHFLAHEYGHYIADTLETNLSVSDYDVIQDSLIRYFDNDIFKTKTSNLINELGSYGSKNPREAFAEAFAEAYTCEKPGKFASIFKEELEKKIGNVSSKISIENVREDGIITLADINKMITPYERKILDRIPAKEEYFDFAAHGASDYIEYGARGKNMRARDVARIIKHHKKYNGQKVRLLSCNTGSVDNGFAQQLSNALGVEVEAPTDVLVVYPDGSFKVGFKGDGVMKRFKPGGGI